MITLASAPATREAIDTAIDAALQRLRTRMTPMNGSADALGAAIQRAAGGGKRFRPTLVVAAYETLGARRDPSAVYSVAAAFELLHSAFVVHDDVIDHDTHRRGVLNIGGEFRERARVRGADASGAALLGDAAGILAGDLLLHEAVRLVALADVAPDVRADLLALLEDAVVISAVGELADVENAVVSDSVVAAEAILLATANKTAVYSFSAPLEAGAVLAGARPEVRLALRSFGHRLGLAYQLVDDLIGAFGPAELAGKAAGGDLREAKRTPLIALARESEQWPQVSDALAQAHTGPVAVRAAQRALAASGARQRMELLVGETLDEACGLVDGSVLPEAGRVMLLDLVEAVRERVP
ncbi:MULTISPECIES: polyprenyl synthetase family protein [Microbacterium]|uniref:Polyprenyl synthetase family protein n=1 Tax=Microbacterium wangchenii TaxID=2541726 RepID=A0ABX5SWN0_9MICO|nr:MULTISPECIES: polyprenyl synthetase family protein [Microbacterium]MCK6067880.1 polyprenyl synthetase family protein [Microbacterium sp. EYE_512]QBR89229.1 polyprenyl synthetase family protein [Microbacterium wangchenii]TXK10901.1 polyprenyl synthetase family protein [Microbacterium wangchenii]